MQKCCTGSVQQRIARYRKRSLMAVKDAPLTRRASLTRGGPTQTITQDIEPEAGPPQKHTRHFPDSETPPPRRRESRPQHRASSRGNTTTWVGVGMVGALLVLLFVSVVIVPWFIGLQHRWDCGAGNVCEVQASLFKRGQQDTVLSFDVNGSVDVVIAPGGDMLKSKMYVIETGVVSGKYVSLTPVDINGDGKMDLFVSLEGEGMQHSLMNDGNGGFTIDGMHKQ